jgi:putative ABC transport system ATP-binding protein
MFEELHKQGKTIILVTHDDELAAKAKNQITLKDGLIEN